MNVVAINKKTREEIVLETGLTEEQAWSFCEAWGWTYTDEYCIGWWLEIR